MRNNKQKILTCPHCGASYIPSEIFIPRYLMEEKEIEKDCCGKILFCEGRDAVLQEQYVCDYCNTQFSVRAYVDFAVETEKEFSEEFSTPITKRITMNEE